MAYLLDRRSYDAEDYDFSLTRESVRAAHRLFVHKQAGAGIEPANSGFADRDLTTWLPRRLARADNIIVAAVVSTRESFRSQAPSIETQVFAAASASVLGQRFNASTNPVIVGA